MSVPTSDFESKQANSESDDGVQADNSVSIIPTSDANDKIDGAEIMDESIAPEHSEINLSSESITSEEKLTDSKPFQAGRAPNDPRLNPREAPQGPVLQNAPKISVEPYLAAEKRVISESHPSQLGRVINDPRKA